ncbi:hypothetical protein JQ597_13060 [Bradyrhizobium sp. AUGA SZCCT0177]|uniref:hypothetical protein n=1 Tax=Bradyrhizobium sp. AUGA SZCCT0177 TaxID=2807665 RepID=UPI001BAD76B3|nr:hypothetical protein [Bradyrhizobium sp. AUGA SZCCT0177]MBR1282971.1 hypothetical protein [Bradyrhizobium sp. AUGA SZCCT0177]
MPLTGLVSQLLPFVAAASLGLLAGALLAEDRLLLPYWRTLSADTFYELHPSYGPRLYRFFAPLTTAAPMAAVLAAIQIVLQSEGVGPRTTAAITAAVLAWSLVAIYLVYFRSANDAFARHAVSPEDLSAVLARWAGWHRARVLICLAAFALSLVALAA